MGQDLKWETVPTVGGNNVKGTVTVRCETDRLVFVVFTYSMLLIIAETLTQASINTLNSIKSRSVRNSRRNCSYCRPNHTDLDSGSDSDLWTLMI